MHYTGKLKDGTEFDTSAGRGETATSIILPKYDLCTVVFADVNDVNDVHISAHPKASCVTASVTPALHPCVC